METNHADPFARRRFLNNIASGAAHPAHDHSARCGADSKHGMDHPARVLDGRSAEQVCTTAQAQAARTTSRCTKFFPAALKSSQGNLLQANLPCCTWVCTHCAGNNKAKWRDHLDSLLERYRTLYLIRCCLPEWEAVYARIGRAGGEHSKIITGRGAYLVVSDKPISGATAHDATEARKIVKAAIRAIEPAWRRPGEHPVTTSHKWRLTPKSSGYTLATPKPVSKKAWLVAVTAAQVPARTTAWDGELVTIAITAGWSAESRTALVNVAVGHTSARRDCSIRAKPGLSKDPDAGPEPADFYEREERLAMAG